MPAMPGYAVRLAPFVFILLWSSSFVTARIGLQFVSPLLFVALRLASAALLLAALATALGHSWGALRGRFWQLALAGALVNGVTLAAFHVGMLTVNAAVMALIQGLNPLLVALLGIPVLGERLSFRQWLGLCLGFAGVALVVGPRVLGSAAELEAVLLGGIGVLGLSVGTVAFGRHGRGLPLLPATAVQLGAAAVLVLALMAVFEAPAAAWSFAAIASVVWNVFCVSIGGMALFYLLLNRGAAGEVAANFYLLPGLVALLGWSLLGETLAPLALAGLAVASGGVFLVARR